MIDALKVFMDLEVKRAVCVSSALGKVKLACSGGLVQ